MSKVTPPRFYRVPIYMVLVLVRGLRNSVKLNTEIDHTCIILLLVLVHIYTSTDDLTSAAGDAEGSRRPALGALSGVNLHPAFPISKRCDDAILLVLFTCAFRFLSVKSRNMLVAVDKMPELC